MCWPPMMTPPPGSTVRYWGLLEKLTAHDHDPDESILATKYSVPVLNVVEPNVIEDATLRAVDKGRFKSAPGVDPG